MSKNENKEQAYKLFDKGKSIKEVSSILDIPYGTVYCWLRGCEGKKENASDNSDRHKCRTCQFRAGSWDKGKLGMNCNYIDIVGHSRGCTVDECNVYVKGKRLDRKR